MAEKGPFRIVIAGRGGRRTSMSGGDIPTSCLDRDEAKKALEELGHEYKGTEVRLKIDKMPSRYKWLK